VFPENAKAKGQTSSEWRKEEVNMELTITQNGGLLLPVVRFAPAEKPNAMLLTPVVLLRSVPKPSAVLEPPVVLLLSAP